MLLLFSYALGESCFHPVAKVGNFCDVTCSYDKNLKKIEYYRKII